MSGNQSLIQAAIEAQQHAVAPYSGYRVGAALKATSGQIFKGCNIEPPILGLGKCAEQVAIFSAMAQGFREFSEIAVMAPNGGTPCGACRQMIWDLCGNITVHIKTDDGIKTYQMSELLPDAFDSSKIR